MITFVPPCEEGKVRVPLAQSYRKHQKKLSLHFESCPPNSKRHMKQLMRSTSNGEMHPKPCRITIPRFMDTIAELSQRSPVSLNIGERILIELEKQNEYMHQLVKEHRRTQSYFKSVLDT